jgi:pimeloyl-ACP methyl ester carboxylesterase
MTTFVLVHSPLVGPAVWQPAAAELERRGHGSIVPSLQSATASGPPFAEPQAAAIAAAVAEAGGGTPVVLVGHSGAGALLPVAGRALGARVDTYLFVDAALPTPGRSRFADLHPAFQGRLLSMVCDGMLPPWHHWWGGRPDDLIPDPEVRDRVFGELRPLPLAMFEEPLPVVEGWPDRPCAYLRLSDAYASEEASAAGRGWPVTRLDGSHLEMLIRPGKVVDSLLALVGRLAP